MRLVAVILLLVGGGLVLGDGVAVAENVPMPVPLPRPRPPIWAEPQSFLEAAGPDFNSAEVTAEPSDCRKRLDVIAAIVAVPRLIGPGACGGSDMVQLDAVLIPGHERIVLKPAPVVRCAMAESLAAWIRDEAAPRVAAHGAALHSVDTYDDFDCRGRNRVVGAKLSEHGKGNAVDVRSFTLADHHVIELTDMTAPKDLRESIRESVCGRFTTVLGPGSDGYHEGHIHLDLAERSRGYRICQWEVREPPKPEEIASAKVPLPTSRPSIPGEPAAQKL
jgi:hypothetical protein